MIHPIKFVTQAVKNENPIYYSALWAKVRIFMIGFTVASGICLMVIARLIIIYEVQPRLPALAYAWTNYQKLVIK